MRDTGNDAMLSAASRHYDALYNDDAVCCDCSDCFTPDADTLFFRDETYCEYCAEKAMPRFAFDLWTEVLFEDEGERSAFFSPQHETMRDAA